MPNRVKTTEANVTYPEQGGIYSKMWFWASDLAKPGNKKEKEDKDSDSHLGTMPAVDPNKLNPDERAVSDMLVDNPQMSASTFLNLLKSKGYEIKAPQDIANDSVKATDSAETLGKKEADGSGSFPQLVRGKTKECDIKDNYISFLFREGVKSDSVVGPTKFKVVLIQEGLGNLKDAFFYSRSALESAVAVFEGKKVYADHPDALEEQTRPERSVKDVLGHFQNVHIEEGSDGQAMLCADLVTMPDDPYKWARALMRHAVEFSDKFPDKDFIGLSINASGDAEEMPLESLIEGGKVPDSAIPKLKKALEQGIETVRVVSSIKEAVSCDLVTEAGAGGRFLAMLEKEKQMPKHEGEEKKHESDGQDQDQDQDQDQGHDDADQDKHLIKKMIKKHLGDDAHDEAMKHAEEAAAGYMQHEKMEAEEAAKCGAMAVKHAMRVAKKEAAKHAEGEEKKKEDSKVSIDGVSYAEGEEKKEGKQKESQVARLSGRVAFLETELKKERLEKLLDTKLRESKLPRAATDKLRKTIGELRSESQIKTHIDNFMEGYRLGGEAQADSLSYLAVEKRPVRETLGGEAEGFADCVLE